MSPARAAKSSDKTQVCRNLVTGLQKLYGKSLPRLDLPVLETFLFAVCLEDDSWADAQAGYQRLISSHFDLNEIRVSSVTELERVLNPLQNADWKALRIRSVLRFVFESGYSFEYEKFRKLTQEVALRTMKKVNDLSPFVRDFVMQQILACHVIPLDASMTLAARWLGAVPSQSDSESAGELLKSAVKKAQGAEFSHLLRCLATDAKYRERFKEMIPDDSEIGDVSDRIQELQSPSKRKVTKPAPQPAATVASAKTAAKPVSGASQKTSVSAPPTHARPNDKSKIASKTPAAAKSSASAKPVSTPKPADKSAPPASAGKGVKSTTGSAGASAKKSATPDTTARAVKTGDARSKGSDLKSGSTKNSEKGSQKSRTSEGNSRGASKKTDVRKK
ncbi:MAG: hypothetical protein ACK526_15260 [Planctomyces sp.]|jgi:hypothetical protein